MSEQREGKGSLPYGWIVKTSKRYPDRIYYFNIYTGSSTWECPELNPANSMSKEGIDAKIKNEENKSVSLCNIENQLSKPQLQTHSMSTSNELNSDHKEPTPSNDILKTPNPPTAVVVPVIHTSRNQKKILHKNKSNSVSSDASCSSKKCKIVNKCDSLVKSEKKKSKKKKISPLNRPDSDLDQKPKKKKGKKHKKDSTSSVNFDKDNYSEPCSTSNLQSFSNETNLSENNDMKNDEDDIEMLDVSMEVIEEIKAVKETIVDTFASYYVVVDTNVLISELHLINELKDTPLDGCGPPHIFIPWVVIQELDRLKSNKSSKIAMRGACEAIRYLNSVLGKHPRFHGQSPVEAESWAKTYSRCNDDRLLECCIALGDKMSPEKVILLTNDKNLVNKALICTINVHDWKSMMKFVKPDVVFSLTKQKQEIGANKPDCPQRMESDDLIILTQRNKYKKEIHTIMATARQLLKNVLSQFVELEMNKAYGSAWIFFPIQRNLLEGMLLTIIRYWNMVFSKLGNDQKSNIQSLYKVAVRPEGFYGDREECLQILTMIEGVFLEIKKKHPKMKINTEKIKVFRAALVDAFSTYLKLENSVRDTEQAATIYMFERNWSAINHLCGMILDFCKIKHDLKYDKPMEALTEPEIRRLLCNLYPGVQQFKALMFRILDSLCNNMPTKKITNKLYKALINFIPSLEIPYEATDYPHVSAESINNFCISPQNREMIEIGYKQIERFFIKLDEALTTLMASNFKKGCASPETMICD